MLNLKTVKKNLFLTLLIIAAFIFIASVMCSIMGEASPVKFIVNESTIKLAVPSALVFFVTFILYRNSKKDIKENVK